MESKETYIEYIEQDVWGYNSYWDLAPETSELRTNTKQAVDKLLSYFTILQNSDNRLKDNYVDNDDDLKMIVNNIICICNDGVDRRLPVSRNGVKHTISHVDENNLLPIEKNIKSSYTIKRFIEECNKLKEILESENTTIQFDKFLGKILVFNGYEEGIYNVLFHKINKTNKGTYTYDGYHVLYCTENISRGYGVLCYDVEDAKFSSLPYAPYELDEKTLYNYLNAAEEISIEDLKKEMQDVVVQSLMHTNTSIYYYLNKHTKKN